MIMASIGIIDIGSNSVRLMLSENGVNSAKTTVTTRLGEGLMTNGFLLDDAIMRSVQCVKDFYTKCKNEGVKKVYAFATAAVRNASNGKVFTDIVFKETGITVDVVAGDKEGILAVKGALNEQDGTIIDLGGASTEITVQQGGRVIYSHSLPLGCVLLKDLTHNNRNQAEKIIKERLYEYGQVPFSEKVVAVGGTATNIASVMLELSVYDPDKVQDYILERNKLKNLVDKLYSLTVEERKGIIGLNKQRADVVDGGALLLLRISEMLCCKEIAVSERDNLEGYLHFLMQKEENEQ